MAKYGRHLRKAPMLAYKFTGIFCASACRPCPLLHGLNGWGLQNPLSPLDRALD